MKTKKSLKRVLSLIITLCLALAMVAIPVTVSAVTEDVQETSATDYGLTDDVQDGQILQIWNWSYNATKANMKKIAEQGFTAIQTSPIQQAKEGTSGKQVNVWWIFYQPAWFHIDNTGNSALGNKSEFEAMCAEAEKYGIKVIVDAVLNHTGNQTGNDVSSAVDPELKNDSSCWHDISRSTSDWNSRWKITQLNMGGLPDLNTASKKVQNKEIAFLKECVDAGADGFRFDGTKHIEVPNDVGVGSDFWPSVIGAIDSYASSKGVDLYHYGEILDKTAGGQNVLDQYTQYMSVTLNNLGNDIRHSVQNRNANGAKRTDFSMQDGSVAANKAVVWNESHDTYGNDSRESTYASTGDLNRTWAIVGTRNGSCGMYLARPNGFSDSLGAAAVNGWANPEVAAVNHFNNFFEGQNDYVSTNGSIVAVERGTAGVVLTNVAGQGSTSVNMKMNKMANGTYKDEITGNTFTVSNGQISGQIGSTGIAVVYNGEAITSGPSASVSPGSSSYKTDSLQLTLSFDDATSGQYSIDGGSFQSYSNGQKITIGAGEPFGTKTTVAVKATGAEGTSDTETYTYTKVDPSQVQRVYFDNSSYNWSQVYCYIYNDVDGEGGGGTDPTPDPDPDPDPGTTGTTIKFTDSLNWGNVNAYFFNSSGTVGSEWPGSSMSSYETNPFGQKNYTIDIPSGATSVIFNNGSAQTVDLSLSGVEGYYCDGSQTDGKYNGIAWDASAMTSETVTVDKNAASSDAVVGAEGDPDTTPANAPWPGELMTLDSSTGYYVLDVPEGFENGMVVFTESETPSAANRYPADKEPGLALEGNSMLFEANHEWSVYSAPSPTTQPTTAKPTPAPTQPTTAKPTTPPTTTVTVMLGDANGDNRISLLDIFEAQKSMTQQVALSTENAAAADISGNGRVGLEDIIEMQKYMAQINTLYDVGEIVTIEV